MAEPTLGILTKKYKVIIFKHCFPVGNIQPDQDSADIEFAGTTVQLLFNRNIDIIEKNGTGTKLTGEEF